MTNGPRVSRPSWRTQGTMPRPSPARRASTTSSPTARSSSL